MRSAFALPLLTLIACNEQRVALDDVDDSGSTADATSDGATNDVDAADATAELDTALPTPDPVPGECADLTPLPANGTLGPFSAAGLRPPDRATCYDPPQLEQRQEHFVAALAPGTGLRIVATPSDPSSSVWLSGAQPCGPTTPGACRYWSALWPRSEALTEGQEELILTNSTQQTAFYAVVLGTYGSPAPQGTVSLETQTYALAANAACADATPLRPDELVEVGRLGARDAACLVSDQPVEHFAITIPAMTWAAPLANTYPLYAIDDCATCAPARVRNDTQQPMSAVVVGTPGTIGWTPVELASNATCAGALELVPGTPITQNHDTGGNGDQTCLRYGDTEHPLFWRVTVPGGSTARVWLFSDPPSGDMAQVLRVQDACGGECLQTVESTSGEAVLEIVNPGAEPQRYVVAGSVGFAPPPGVSLTVRVEFE